MPRASIVAVIESETNFANEKLRRRSLRDASDPLSYHSAVFISYFRLNKEGFVLVMDKITPHLASSSIPTVLQLATTLRFLATGAFQGAIGKDFDIALGRSTVSTIIWRVLYDIQDVICPEWVKLRMTSSEKSDSKAYFFQKFGIPGIIGCIDCTHIKLSKPREDESLFLNRKGTFSLNVMIICDYRMKVLAVDASTPGSCHDSFVWNNSDARKCFLHQYNQGDRSSWFLGDARYGLEPFLITPYKDVSGGTVQHTFNKSHASGRNIVERTIGVLKSRFRCLHGTLVYTPKKVVTITNVCYALNNICRELNVAWEEVPITEDNFGDDINVDEVEETSQRSLFNVGKRLRDNIAAGLN